MERVFRPASALLGQLRFAHKFFLVGLVLAVPLAVVVFAYSREQRRGVAATNMERAGLTAMDPLLALGEDVAVARHAAVTSGHAVAVAAADIAAVDQTQRKYGKLLRTATQWQELRQQLLIAGVTSGHATALAAYDGVDIGLENLVVAVGDASKLSVDPDLDATYLLDGIERRIPTLLDTANRIVDQFNVDSREGFPDRAQLLSQVDLAVGSMDSAAAALDAGFGTAAQHTRDMGVRYVLPGRLSVLDGTVSLLDERLRNVRLGRAAVTASPGTAQPLTAAADQLTAVGTSAIDRLLRARIAADTGRAHLVELLAAGAALAAIYLFGGFYFCVAGAVRRMLVTLRAVAAGRLSEEVVVANRDELGHIAAAINDMVGKVRHATEQLAHDATHDNLTGLPNRSSVIGELERSLPRASRQQSLSVLFVDLDGFKLINDSLGHAVGDEVLRQVSTRLAATTRPSDSVSRLSGDEFVLVCRGLGDVLDAIAVAERVLSTITPPMTVPAHGEMRRVSVGASIGVVFVTDPGTSADQLVRDADVAMYRAKELGRSRVEVFDEGMRAVAEQRQLLCEELRQAIAEDQVEVYYQPVVELRTNRIRGYEALARWEHPERGLLVPGAFMAEAERSGLIVPLGAIVLREACRQLAIWQADPAMHPGLRMSVNLSARQLADNDIADVVLAAVAEAGIDPEYLCLEITESALLADADTATEVLMKLRAIGVRLALDDFGTGYSSLQHLKIFPLDVIKIDRSFVLGLGADDGDEAIVRTVIGLANALGVAVVAEGVETSRQLTWLLDLGCYLAQGYLWARPAPASEISADVVATTEARTGETPLS
jgi:diguanylate cyclase (GGDEF)-like protein